MKFLSWLFRRRREPLPSELLEIYKLQAEQIQMLRDQIIMLHQHLLAVSGTHLEMEKALFKAANLPAADRAMMVLHISRCETGNERLEKRLENFQHFCKSTPNLEA